MPPFIDKAELAAQGWTVVKGMVPLDITARMRQLMDDILGPPAKDVPETEYGWGSREAVWSAVEDAYERGTPVVDSGNWMHTIRHPIQCHDAGVCAEIVSKTGVVELHEDLLKSNNVKLMQQMLRRTDVDPEATKRGRSFPMGWHMDHGFIPRLYQTEPRQMYYHTMTALNNIGPGGAPFMIVDNIYPKIKKVIESFDDDYMATLVGEDFRGNVPARIMEDPEMIAARDEANAKPPVGVLMDEGDMVVFDPMCLHSPSHADDTPRYAYFSTYFDAACDYILLPQRGASAPSFKYPPEMREAMDPKHVSVLDWEFPDDGASQYDTILHHKHFPGVQQQWVPKL